MDKDETRIFYKKVNGDIGPLFGFLSGDKRLDIYGVGNDGNLIMIRTVGTGSNPVRIAVTPGDTSGGGTTG